MLSFDYEGKDQAIKKARMIKKVASLFIYAFLQVASKNMTLLASKLRSLLREFTINIRSILKHQHHHFKLNESNSFPGEKPQSLSPLTLGHQANALKEHTYLHLIHKPKGSTSHLIFQL